MSITVVSSRWSLVFTIVSRRSNAAVPASWSSVPVPTMARKASDETISLPANCSTAHAVFPDALGPTSTTNEGAGSLVSM